jgi:hypothetical protein
MALYLLGLGLASATETDFFTQFSLVPDLEAPTLSARERWFRPSSERFHDVVLLIIALDERERVHSLTLHMARSFIDRPGNNEFARDIAKSFIRFAAHTPPDSPVAMVIGQIEDVTSASPPVADVAAGVSPNENEISLGYQVYLGQRDEYDVQEEGHTFRMANVDGSSGRVLEVRIVQRLETGT